MSTPKPSQYDQEQETRFNEALQNLESTLSDQIAKATGDLETHITGDHQESVVNILRAEVTAGLEAQADFFTGVINGLIEERKALIWLVAEQQHKLEVAKEFMTTNRAMIRASFVAARGNQGSTAPTTPQQPPQAPQSNIPTTPQGQGIKCRCGNWHPNVNDVRACQQRTMAANSN